GAIYRSDDRGWNWVRTSASLVPGMGEPADDAKVNGRKLAVDPRNPDVLLASSPRGPIRLTINGGDDWIDIEGIPAAQTSGHQAMGDLLLFDPGTPEVNGRTSGVYASSWGNGVFR